MKEKGGVLYAVILRHNRRCINIVQWRRVAVYDEDDAASPDNTCRELAKRGSRNK